MKAIRPNDVSANFRLEWNSEGLIGISLLAQFAHRMVRRQHAEAVTLDFQRAVEPRAKILQGDGGSQFNNLFGAEQSLNFREHSIGNVGRRTRHPFGVAQHRLFTVIEMRARLKSGQRL